MASNTFPPPAGQLSARYQAMLEAMLTQALAQQAAVINQAAQILADSFVNRGLWHVFGTGHSHMLAEEVFGRAGGLIPVNAILLPRLMLHENMLEATLLERQETLATNVLAGQDLRTGDVILVISNSGRNGLPVEIARQTKARGLTVLVMTAAVYSSTLASRHSSGLRLAEVADLVLDNGGAPGDAGLYIPEHELYLGATSTVIGAAILNAVTIETIAELARRGYQPPILISANLAGPNEGEALDRVSRVGERVTLQPLSPPAEDLQSRLAARYAEGDTPWDDALPPPEVQTLTAELSPGRALDLGCGLGRTSIYLAQRGWQVDGVDFVELAVHGAAKRAAAAGVQVQFHCLDVRNLDKFKPGYNLAIDVGCAHALDAAGLEAYHAHLKRLLAPGASYLLFARLADPADEAADAPSGLDEALLRRTFSNGFRLVQADHGITEMAEDKRWRSAWFHFQRLDPAATTD